MSHARQQLDLLQQGGPGQLNGFGDLRHGGDVELEDHGAADVVLGVGDEFVEEDVVVDGVADRAADDADGKGQGCDCGDEVVGADDGGDDGGWDDDAADAEAGEDEEAPECVEVVDASTG